MLGRRNPDPHRGLVQGPGPQWLGSCRLLSHLPPLEGKGCWITEPSSGSLGTGVEGVYVRRDEGLLLMSTENGLPFQRGHGRTLQSPSPAEVS